MAAAAAPAALPTMPRAQRAATRAPPPDDGRRRPSERFRAHSAPSASPRQPSPALASLAVGSGSPAPQL